MSDEPDYALVGCPPVTMLPEPNVPSWMSQCKKCGTDLWVSADLLRDLTIEGFPPERIHPVCAFTCLVIADDAGVLVTENQRRMLRERGISDEDIDNVIKFLNETVQREGK